VLFAVLLIKTENKEFAKEFLTLAVGRNIVDFVNFFVFNANNLQRIVIIIGSKWFHDNLLALNIDTESVLR
jgi:hypothetical protein